MQLARRLGLALLLVGGCSKGPPAAMLTCSPPECSYRTTLALVAEVNPAPMGPQVKQEFTSLSIDPNTGFFSLQLDAPVTLKGTVTVTRLGAAQPVAATIVATRASRISGRPNVYYQTASDPQTGAYRLVVSPNVAGEQYTLRVTPDDRTLVPPTRQMVTATADQELDFAYPDVLQLAEIHGKVTNSLQMAVAGMQVQASDPLNGGVVSTTAVTDATGSFSLRMSPSGPAVVKLTAMTAPATAGMTPPPTPTPPMPTLTRVATLPPAAMPASSLEANLELPALPVAAHFTYGIMSPSLSGAMTPVVGATCVFSADLSDPNSIDGVTATYTATAITDAKGVASVFLVPAVNGNRSYDLSITPDPTSSFQSTTTTVKVAPQGGYTPIMGLAIRPQLYGRVLDATRKPLLAATVAPTPATLGPATNQPAALHPIVPAAAPPATAGSDGNFSLRLDPGVWDVELIAPAEAMLPRLWVPGTNVVSNTDLGDLMIPRGVMVHGVVRDAYNQPVAVADVLLYTVAPGNGKCAPGDASCLAPARLRAEGPTDNTGAVGIILPNKPVD